MISETSVTCLSLVFALQVEQWLVADNNAELRKENVEMIVPLLRFCKMTPTELLTIESSPLMEQFPKILQSKLGTGKGKCVSQYTVIAGSVSFSFVGCLFLFLVLYDQHPVFHYSEILS